MSKFITLYSSSSGNCSFLGEGNSGILIDAGVSCKRICEALSSNEISPERIEGILITHIHSDHIKGLLNFTKKFHTPVYAGIETARYLCKSGSLSTESALNIFSTDSFCVGDYEITPFETPHDTAESFGFRIKNPQSKILASCTDLGEVTETVHKNLLGADVCFIEANYDEVMLKNGSYPYPLKQRIRSDHGHLSNTDSAKEIEELIKNGTRQIILGHLSRENNTPFVAQKTVCARLCEFPDIKVTVAPDAEPGKAVFL